MTATTPNQENGQSHEAVGETIEIKHGAASATINPEGLYIVDFKITTENGAEDILFPQQDCNGKTRGTHLCIPNFGPDATGILPQHGFARNVTWETDDSEYAQSSHRRRFQHRRTDSNDPYRGLFTDVSIDVLDSGEGISQLAVHSPREALLYIDVMLQNDSNKPLRVAPALHPYFQLPEGVSADQVKVNSKQYTTEELALAQTERLAGTSVVEMPGGRRIELHTRNMPYTTVWAGGDGTYICVEPSANGPSFASEDAQPNEYLQPDEARTYRTIIVTPIV